MATYDLTLGSTQSTEAANSIAALPAKRRSAYMVEATLDISKIDSYTCVNGDIFRYWKFQLIRLSLLLVPKF